MSNLDSIDNFREKWHKAFEKIKENNINLDGYISLIQVYYDLKKENPALIPRETLQNNTRTIMSAQNLLLSNFYQILGIIVKRKMPQTNIRTIGILNELAPILKVPPPANIQNINMPNIVLDFVNANIVKYVVILQGSNPEVIDFLKNIRTKLVCIIHINFEKEKSDSILLTSESEEITQKTKDFIDRLHESSEYLFPSKLPVLELQKIPNEKQVNSLIDEILRWVKEEVKNIADLKPTEKISVTKSNGKPEDGQISPRMAFSIKVTPDKEDRIILKFVTSGKQCSPYRLHIYLDGVEKTVTEWFGYSPGGPDSPMDSTILSLDDISSDTHEIKLQPEGKQEGCNQGYIEAWDGDLYLY